MVRFLPCIPIPGFATAATMWKPCAAPPAPRACPPSGSAPMDRCSKKPESKPIGIFLKSAWTSIWPRSAPPAAAGREKSRCTWVGSVHYVVPPNNAEPFTVDGSPEEMERGIREGFGGDGEAMMHAYWDAVAEMIALGGFAILGHADLVKKNNRDGRWFNGESESCRERIGETVRAVAAAGLVVEVNTGGLNRRRTDETYPSPFFLRRCREQGVPVLITADAHCAEHLDGHYDTARRTLLEAGCTEHVLFAGKGTGFVPRPLPA